jgi:hypothetical protein
MTTPEQMLVVREAEWLSEGMLPVSIKVLTCASTKEPYEAPRPLAGPEETPSSRFCVWHGISSSLGTCCSGVMDFVVIDEAITFVETRFPGAKWLAAPQKAKICVSTCGSSGPACQPEASPNRSTEIADH